jgi:phosphatidylglycerol:prolipoprotein diacylglycerol transferase
MLGVALLLLLLWARRRQSFRGQIFLLFTFAYGAARFMLEMVRDDPERGSVPPSMPAHVLLPLCLALFAVGYVLSVSRLVASERARRISQVLVFVPAVVLALVLSPGDFAGPAMMALSTSQFIGLASGLAACGVYFVFDRAAMAHPETAMSLDIFKEYTEPETAPETATDHEERDADESEADDSDDAPSS